MKKYQLKFIILAILCFGIVDRGYSQSPARDSSFHPYHVNYWITGPLLGVGLVANYFGIPKVLHKREVSLPEIESLNKNIVNGFDSWAFRQDLSKMEAFENYSDYALNAGIALPFLLIFSKKIRHNWGDVLLIYMETMTITTNIFEWSFIGPTFQNRLRPVAYYDQLTYEERKSGNNWNSLYSGHVAAVSASSFFMAKVISDYNPGLGNNKYLVYTIAAIPPLTLAYFRVKAIKHFPSDVLIGVGIGALCGIIIPETHRIKKEKISLGLFSTPEGTGISLNWKPEFGNRNARF